MKSALVAALLLMPAVVEAQADSTVTVSFGGFVDVYYAYFINMSGPTDVPLLTQPVRTNEFNTNLVYLDTKVAGDRVRGRFAIQLGTSVCLPFRAIVRGRAGLGFLR